MRYKFNRRKIKYVVKPEEKMVVGWIDTRDPKALTTVVKEFKNKKANCDAMFWLMVEEDIKDIDEEKNRYLKAISRCDEHDEFDEKIGKKIVADILEKKYHQHMMRKYARCNSAAFKVSNECFTGYWEHAKRLAELEDRIDSYKE